MNQPPIPPQSDPTEKKSFFQRHILPLKLLLIGFLLLLLLIPLFMVESLIRERENTAENVRAEIADKWSKAQQITGPVLSVPCIVQAKTVNAQGIKTLKYISREINILPEDIKIEGNIDTQTLRRGLYEVVVYGAKLRINGSFRLSEEDAAHLAECQADFEKAHLSIGLTDLRGLEQNAVLQWDGQTADFSPGTGEATGLTSVISVSVNAAKISEKGNVIPFSTTLDFKGSETLHFIPVGKTTSVSLKSNCPNPSFTGNFLPSRREVSDGGFYSLWNIIGMNRNYPQVMQNIGSDETVQQSAFGVELLVPVTQYQMANRAVKYAVLIILLTLTVMLLADIVLRRHLGPLPYLLTGLALVLFYSLLLSLSEHIGFAWAYLASSTMTIALLFLYMHSVLHKWKPAWGIAGMLATLYAFIYILMQMESYSLLAGSLGLFVLLAAVMYLSQKMGIENIKG